MESIAADAAKAIMGAGPVAALLFYFLRQKQGELDRANAKIDALQDKVVSMLSLQLEAEPQRRETLSKIAQSIADANLMLKERLRA